MVVSFMRQTFCSPDLERTPVSLHVDDIEELLPLWQDWNLERVGLQRVRPREMIALGRPLSPKQGRTHCLPPQSVSLVNSTVDV